MVIRHRDVSDDELFEAARLVVAAEIAKIHTIEWTTQLLYDEPLYRGMNANWNGLFSDQDLVDRALGSVVVKLAGRNDPRAANSWYSVLAAGSGIVGLGSERYAGKSVFSRLGSGTDVWDISNPDHVNGGVNHFGSPFNFPEEFTTVYRLHPLVLGAVAHVEFVKIHPFDDGNGRTGSKVAGFSNYGKKEVDVFAPGVQIYSTIPGGNKYNNASGTSMASPVVAGAAALIHCREDRLRIVRVHCHVDGARVVVPEALQGEVLGDLNARRGRVQGTEAEGEHLQRITERFYRVDLAKSRVRGGTGLGLAIVKHIVQAHQAELKIESILQKGTTVHVLLPAVGDESGHKTVLFLCTGNSCRSRTQFEAPDSGNVVRPRAISKSGPKRGFCGNIASEDASSLLSASPGVHTFRMLTRTGGCPRCCELTRSRPRRAAETPTGWRPSWPTPRPASAARSTPSS